MNRFKVPGSGFQVQGNVELHGRATLQFQFLVEI